MRFVRTHKEDTPVVFLAADPVARGLVTNLARPGGNLTGVSTLGPDVIGKSLELLKQTVPRASAIAVLWHPGVAGDRTVRHMLTAAEADKAFSDMISARVGALIVLPSAALGLTVP